MLSYLLQNSKVKLIFLLSTIDSKIERCPAVYCRQQGKKDVLLSTVDSKVQKNILLSTVDSKIERCPAVYCRKQGQLSTGTCNGHCLRLSE